MHKTDIVSWLRRTDPVALTELYRQADRIRHETVGDEVHMRGLIEISNICTRQCGYCGLRAGNEQLRRYRMQVAEILRVAMDAESLGYGTVVLQSGESAQAIPVSFISSILRTVKERTNLAMTLSLGERCPADLAFWREFGADRYLLRFETSDPELYRRIHPPQDGIASDRIQLLRVLRKLGYETGSGVMIGIPGQSYESLADDLELFSTMDLDMIGVGPYIAHPFTPLGNGEWQPEIDPVEQVPNTEEMVYKVIALARILRPDANIPATTALATINPKDGRELGLMRGANVVMPNLTPGAYRKFYEIYPNKACVSESSIDCNGCLRGRLRSIGRFPGRGRGGRQKVAACV